MLERGDDDFISGENMLGAPRGGDEVQALGRSAREDQPPRVGDAEEFGDSLAGLVIALGRADRKRVRAAMGIGVVVLAVGAHRAEYRAGLLRRRTRLHGGQGMTPGRP